MLTSRTKSAQALSSSCSVSKHLTSAPTIGEHVFKQNTLRINGSDLPCRVGNVSIWRCEIVGALEFFKRQNEVIP